MSEIEKRNDAIEKKRKYAKGFDIQRKRRGKRTRGGNRPLTRRVLGFIGVSLGILLLPFGFLHWGYRSVTQKRDRVRYSHEEHRETKKRSKGIHDLGDPSEIKAEEESYSPNIEAKLSSLPKNEAREADESSDDPPRSKPRNEGDHYIRKRMIISCLHEDSNELFTSPSVGEYLELETERGSTPDDISVKLLLAGRTVGYLPVQEQSPYVSGLSLGRKFYAVVTDRISESEENKIEIETWFSVS